MTLSPARHAPPLSRSHDAAGQDTDWRDLAAELDLWGAAGREATLWWRDDDAVAATDALSRLLDVAGKLPLTLAVIPGKARSSLPRAIAGRANVAVMQHGWRHTDHAAPGAKSCEFPDGRDGDAVSADLARGRTRIETLFGSQGIAAFAAPWNRFAMGFAPLLARHGIGGLSCTGPRAAATIAGVPIVNVHVDLVDWTGTGGFVGIGNALAELIRHLRARRTGAADPDEPSGIMSHHLVQDEAGFGFLAALADATRAHPAARWLDGRQIFAAAAG